MSPEKTVVAFGETLWDLLPAGPVLGGAPFNFAYRINSLGDRGLIVSRLGRDELGEGAWKRARELGMDTSYLQWDATHPTGTVEVTLDEENNPDFFIVPEVAYDNIELTRELVELASSADCLCFGTLIQRTPRARHTLKGLLHASKQGLKLLDINLRRDCHSRETIALSLQEADVLKLNDQEARRLAEMFALAAPDLPTLTTEMMERWALSHCVVTFGQRGAFAASARGDSVYVPGYRVNVVDTCGSGDAFAAGFLHRLLRGCTLVECCELGNALGAIVATQPGATAPIRAGEVTEFVEAERERVFEPALRPFASL